MTLTLGWFSTGRGPGSRGLLDFVHKSIRHGDALADIAFVFSNREHGESEETDLFFDLIRKCDIPLINLSYKRFVQGFTGPKSAIRLEFDRKVMSLLEG